MAKISATKQLKFFASRGIHAHCHGGMLRKVRAGRFARPLTSKDPLHLVFKVERQKLRTRSLRTHKNFKRIHDIVGHYSKRFYVKVEQISIQGDHIHALVRTSRRSNFHNFFRVVAGQISQQFQKEGWLLPIQVTGKKPLPFWRHRPFSQVVKGWKANKTIRDYIQLNEKEGRFDIAYQKERLRGLSPEDWKILWT